MNSARLTLITFLGLSLVCLGVGLVGVPVIERAVRDLEFRLELASNTEYAMRFAAAIESQLEMGVPPDQIRDYIQRSFESVPSTQDRYLCLLSNMGEVLCHPRENLLGRDAGAMRILSFAEDRVSGYADWVAAGNEVGYMVGSDGQPTELIRRVAIDGVDWSVLVHTDLAVLDAEAGQLNRTIMTFLVPMGLGLVLLGTLVVRSLGRKYERLIEDANRSLERHVAERTAELEKTIDELQKARDALLLNEKLALLGQLVAGIAHEIKNPLNAITLHAGVLEEDAANRDDREAASNILRSAERCDMLVQSLLAFARNEAPRRRPTPINDVVETAIGFCISEFKGTSIRLERELTPRNPVVEIDPLQIEQVVLNLILNAVQAHRERNGEGWIKVSTILDGTALRLEVRDDAGGIPDEIRNTLFQPFHTTKPQGTGLGLSLSRRFVERNGASIDYQKLTNPSGSLFVIELGGCFAPATSHGDSRQN